MNENIFDEHSDDLLFLLRRFGQNRGFTDRQMIALTLWSISLAIRADVEVNGAKSADAFKRGLHSTISEIDDIVAKQE